MNYPIRFVGTLEKYENNLWNYHIKVPAEISSFIRDQDRKRFMCSLNEHPSFHASLMPAGENVYFIKINKELRDLHNLVIGTSATVILDEDNSQYGMPMPEELRELLDQEPEGNHYFHQLTPGKQRSLIYIVDKVKNVDKRLGKAMIITAHLIEQKGNLDFKLLNQEFKDNNKLPRGLN